MIRILIAFILPLIFIVSCKGRETLSYRLNDELAENNNIQITGLITDTYHVAYMPSLELVWLQEYPSAAFYLSSKLYEKLNLTEGERFTFNVKLGDKSECGEEKYCFEIIK